MSRRTAHPAAPSARSAPSSAAGDDARLSARDQLLLHATPIFAAKGFAAASTREICEAAGVNIASISYYFGDKEGLYREVLLRPISEMTQAFGAFDDPALSFEDAMRMFLAPFIGMAAQTPEEAEFEAQVMKLHLREMMEPSAAFREIVAQAIAPAHHAVSNVIARHCGLPQADDDIHQLVFAMAAIANDYCMSREFMKMLAPGVLSRPGANELILDRLVGYCRALLDHEIARRQASPAARRRPSAAARSPAKKRPTPTLKARHEKKTPARRTRTAR